MNHRFAIIGAFGTLVIIGLPFYFASQLQVGSYAKSPQTVEMKIGAKRMIAGGRAKLWYAGGPTGSEYQISCKKDGMYVHPQKGEQYIACGVKVTLLRPAEDSGTGAFKVEWTK